MPTAMTASPKHSSTKLDVAVQVSEPLLLRGAMPKIPARCQRQLMHISLQRYSALITYKSLHSCACNPDCEFVACLVTSCRQQRDLRSRAGTAMRAH
jgi:hypothetical protein